MLTFTLANVRTLIDEYVADEPEGTDVVAHVLSKLGRETLEAHAQRAGLGLPQACLEVEATVREMLQRKHPGTTRVEDVPLNPARWPELSGWVGRYGAYRIAGRSQG